MILLLLQAVGCLSGYSTPEQIHISWTNHSNEMLVSWVLYLPLTNYLTYRSILCSKSGNWTELEANSTAFDQGTWLSRSQYIYTAVIPVSSECIYEYYAGSWMGWSKTYRFSGRTPGDQDRGKTDMLVVADWGGGPLGHYTKELMLKQITLEKIDAILHAGDMAYDLHDFNGMVGDSWLNMIEPIAASIPYMTLPGNHEAWNMFAHYRARFTMPYNSYNKGTGDFYSFNLGYTHFIMINTEFYLDDKYYSEAKTQTSWLAYDLSIANSQRNDRPWIVILTHRNVYCSVDWNLPFSSRNGDCGVDALGVRLNLEYLLHIHAVDLFLQAHVHQYERNTPIYNNQTVKSELDTEHSHFNPKATIYITNGNAGNVCGHNDPLSSTPQNWSLVRTEEFGYGRLVVHNKTHLYYEQYGSNQKKMIDYVWIIKDKPRFK
jgi:acid phosphatase type 7